jgi:hypothetical protein
MLHHVLRRRRSDEHEPEHPERGGADRCASHGADFSLGVRSFAREAPVRTKNLVRMI